MGGARYRARNSFPCPCACVRVPTLTLTLSWSAITEKLQFTACAAVIFVGRVPCARACQDISFIHACG